MREIIAIPGRSPSWIGSCLVTVCILILFCCQANDNSLAREESNKELVKSFVEAVNNRNYDLLDSFIAPDIVRNSQATPDVQVRSREDFKAFLQRDNSVMPDGHQEVQMMIAEGDKVAVYAIYSGTQTGAFGPFPASNKKAEVPFMGILRIENDLIAEIWVEWDNLSMLSQLGHFPPPVANE